MRRIKKLAKGVVTGRTPCKFEDCDFVVESHNPATILKELGQHAVDENPELAEL